MKLSYLILLPLILTLASCTNSTKKIASNEPKIVEEILIDSVWAANGVRFDLKTVNDMQFVAYYDKNRMMTVASRKIGSLEWTKKTLDNQLMWDSHNYVALGIDEAGYIHVSGNMHVHPLAYFRSAKPYDVSTMEAVHKMIGSEETRVTYPSFYNDKNGALYFSYRFGSCGDGDIIVNHFLPEEGKWERYMDQALFEGVEEYQDRAAYHKKIKDADGNFHFLWMWRWTPDVETCHNLCYATTADMKHWKNAAGEAVSLPFRPEDTDVSVDMVPSKGGLHNSRFNITLTKEGEPVIGYVKYDEEGLTQFYMAKFNDGEWLIKQISDWDFRWKFIDGGAFMTIGGRFGFVPTSDDDVLAINWSTEKKEYGQYKVDLNTLDHTDKEVAITKRYPDNLEDNMTDIPDMHVRITNDKAGDYKDGSKFLLKYEALHGGFRQHQPEVIPDRPLSPLVLIRVK